MNEKKLALADIDGTLYKGFMLLPFASFQKEEGLLNQTVFDQINLDVQRYKNKEWDYETFAEKVLIDWSRGLKGFSYSKTLDQAKLFLQGLGNVFYPETEGLIILLNRTHDIF